MQKLCSLLLPWRLTISLQGFPKLISKLKIPVRMAFNCLKLSGKDRLLKFNAKNIFSPCYNKSPISLLAESAILRQICFHMFLNTSVLTDSKFMKNNLSFFPLVDSSPVRRIGQNCCFFRRVMDWFSCSIWTWIVVSIFQSSEHIDNLS